MAIDDTLNAASGEPESPVADQTPTGDGNAEPLPAIGSIYKELFEMDAVEEVSLSTVCCYIE